MPVVRAPNQILSLLEATVIGRSIATFEVFGVNALKTVTPSPNALVGEVVEAAAFDAAGQLQLALSSTRVDIALERTGGIEVTPPSGVNLPLGPRPTARMTFSDGSRLDFKEPARTKRIRISLSRTT